MTTRLVVLWIIQILLAAAFLFSGYLKAFRPLDSLRTMMPWVDDVSPRLVRVIGVFEILGAIGLILPALTGVLPRLTIAAAVLLAVLMVCALVFHVRRGETPRSLPNVVLFVLALIVAFGRRRLGF